MPYILPALGIIFVVMKLAEIGVVATWSWVWVLAPFWLIPLFAIIIFATGSFFVVRSISKSSRSRRF